VRRTCPASGSASRRLPLLPYDRHGAIVVLSGGFAARATRLGLVRCLACRAVLLLSCC
jgi:hypothetical protein